MDLTNLYPEFSRRLSKTCGSPWGHKISCLNGQVNHGTHYGGRAEFGKLDWVICGGETGPNARPLYPDWARSLRDQCVSAGVPYFFKGWGEWLPCSEASDDFNDSKCTWGFVDDDGFFDGGDDNGFFGCRSGVCSEQTFRIGKKRAGRLLDGRGWNEVPQ